MYHLLSRIYVDSEKRIDRSLDVVTISKEIGYEHVPAAHERVGVQYGYATSLDQFTPDLFLEVMSSAYDSKDKVMIYCDGPTYVRLYALLIKSLMPSIDLLTFRWIMLCKKATMNTLLVANGEPRLDILSSVVINSAVVSELHAAKDPLQGVMDELVAQDPNELSLEWHILRLRTDDRVGKVPKATKNILRRIALSNAHDAMEPWGRHLTRPEFWDDCGADMDTLLNATSVFEGCLALPHLASKVLMRPGLYDYRPNDAWFEGMLGEAIQVMYQLEDESSAKRAEMILELLVDDRDMSVPENCLDRVNSMFSGKMRIALAMRDTGKYDENLIRYLLHADLNVLKAALEGAPW